MFTDPNYPSDIRSFDNVPGSPFYEPPEVPEEEINAKADELRDDMAGTEIFDAINSGTSDFDIQFIDAINAKDAKRVMELIDARLTEKARENAEAILC